MSRHAEIVQCLAEWIGLKQPPIAVYYTDQRPENALVPEGTGERGHCCHLTWLGVVADGRVVALDRANYGCGGAGVYLGFAPGLREGFEYFLSTGIPGKLEGERYKKTPELVRTLDTEFLTAPGAYYIYRRLAEVPEDVTPEVVIFLETADQLSGLFTLANYGRPGRDNVITPFCSGCGALVHEPRRQALRGQPKAVIGLFDVSSRHGVRPDQLAFSAPYSMVVEMAADAPESFLCRDEWRRVKERKA